MSTDHDPFDDITVCVTSFRRTWHLNRAIESAWNAGFRKIAIAAAEINPEVQAVIDQNAGRGWKSYRVGAVKHDIGCNNTWMLAAYLSTTDRILLLHDDDFVNPQFGATYREKISPLMDQGLGFVSWRANHLRDDGSVNKTEWFIGPTGVRSSQELEKHVARMGTLCLSPIVSILDRTLTIRACKEAEATLTHNDSLERPGMLLGTEILVYLRHCRAFKAWLFVDELLTMYGCHMGSGTIAHEAKGTCAGIIRGYDRARVQGLMRTAPTPEPKIIFTHGYWGTPIDDQEIRRIGNARATWDHHFGNFSMIEREVKLGELEDSGALGDPRPVAKLRGFLDAGAELALPEDIIAYSNSDIGVTEDADLKLIAAVARGNGVTVCPRRVLTHPVPGRIYRTVKNCKADGGMDIIAISPRLWEVFRAAFPDFYLGREAWDLCFRTLAEEWADGPSMKSTITCSPEEWWKSRAYCDDVAWHEPHESFWKTDRATNPGGAHNRELAREFYTARNNLMGLACVGDPKGAPPQKAMVTVPDEFQKAVAETVGTAK